jgi:pimeloyl-ACP methyl ester carboxylesterase
MTGLGGTVAVARAGGADIRFWRSGTGDPLVLLHPLRAQLEYFLPLQAELPPGMFELIVPDLPGHGRSTAPRTDYTAAYFTDAVAELLDVWDVRDAVVAGESIGASIALGLAAQRNPRVRRVIALNPYDYGRRGGIRRSSLLANAVFTAMLWPGIGPVIAGVRHPAVLRGVLGGGLHDPHLLPDELVGDLRTAGGLPGHARAFRSLMRNWESWIAARGAFGEIEVPVLLAYGQYDWSRAAERDANLRAIPGVQAVSLPGCGHFSALERPRAVAGLIEPEAVPVQPKADQ